MAFTENLNYCMAQRNYSAYRLAKIIGSTNQAVLNWQAGKAIPHTKTRTKIAEHFGISLEELDGNEFPTLPAIDESAKKERPAESETPNKDALIDFIHNASRDDLIVLLEEVTKTLKGIK